MNKVELIGRLTKDVKVAEFGERKNSGKVARSSIAVRDGVDSKGKPKVQFINFIAWNNTADILEAYTKQGDMVALSGRLTQNDYEKDGVMHYTLEVTVSEVELLPQSSKEDEEEDEKPQRKTNKYHR